MSEFDTVYDLTIGLLEEASDLYEEFNYSVRVRSNEYSEIVGTATRGLHTLGSSRLTIQKPYHKWSNEKNIEIRNHRRTYKINLKEFVNPDGDGLHQMSAIVAEFVNKCRFGV